MNTRMHVGTYRHDNFLKVLKRPNVQENKIVETTMLSMRNIAEL